MHLFNICSGFQTNPEGKYVFHLKGPILYLIGPYKISGRVLVLPIQGDGISNTTLGNELHCLLLEIQFKINKNDTKIDNLYLKCLYNILHSPFS